MFLLYGLLKFGKYALIFAGIYFVAYVAERIYRAINGTLAL